MLNIRIWKRVKSGEEFTEETCYIRIFGIKILSWVTVTYRFKSENFIAKEG